MDKLNILYAYMGILCSHMKEWTSGTCCNMDDSWKHAKWKKKKKKKITQHKTEQRTKIDISPEKIDEWPKWPMITWKDVHHH